MSEAISEALWNLISTTGQALQQVPGLAVVVRYIQRSYQHDPFRVLLEVLLFIWAVYYISKRDDSKDSTKLTDKEVEMLIEEWEPEPLVPRAKEVRRTEEDPIPIIDGPSNLRVELTSGEQLQNWATANFLGLQNNKDITEAAIQTVRQYGVGACGPAGFYGSMDVHLDLEKQLAQLLGVEEAIIYAQGFMAVASVIPAFAKRGDIIIADSGVSFAGQTGLEISRSNTYYFNHNDMEDLERVMQQVDIECSKKKLPLTRRFILAEGLYAKHGDKCPLPKLVELKKKYKYRLILDESLSFGCLGPRGLGITDYYGIRGDEIDIIAGSFSNALGSSGGFCAGSTPVVDHQRLSSQAYCYSAALPALLTVSTSLALKQIGSCPDMLRGIRRNMVAFNDIIDESLPKKFVLIGDRDSPLRFVRLAIRHEDSENEVSVMMSLVGEMRKRGFLLTRTNHVESREQFIPPPSVKICLSSGFTKQETEAFAKALVDVLRTN